MLKPRRSTSERYCIDCVIRLLEMDCAPVDRLKELSQIFGLDPSNLDKKFQNAMGMTIKEFFENKRKLKFFSLLDNGHAFGYQIGFQLGFKTDAAFYNWVKRNFGMTYNELLRSRLDGSASSEYKRQSPARGRRK